MPVILTQDGPSLGGFVCLVTIAKAELWKVGQVKPGDKIRFIPISFDQALALELQQDALLENLVAAEPIALPAQRTGFDPVNASAIVGRSTRTAARRKWCTGKPATNTFLIEYGPNVLDLNLRFQVHALMEELKANPVAGILELSPGVRSLQIHYDSRVIGQASLLARLVAIEQHLPPVDSMKVKSRVVHLPMAFEDSATLDAVARYRQSVRDTAPWLPSNTEFMRRINGLESVEQVRDILFQASYMVLGLGDVYLGAPCAVPVDPRHRSLTSKYNPARTYTAEGTVGIGGIYMCIYGMDSPGGYQLVGRTLPIWNKFLKNEVFVDGKPWLLRFFDQVRFYPVSESELDSLRVAFRDGRETISITEEIFDLAEYHRFLHSIEPEMEVFRERQKIAFEQEVAHWNLDAAHNAASVDEEEEDEVIEVVGTQVLADISGNVWKLVVELGAVVKAGDTLLILEAMKMEFAISAPCEGVVQAFHCKPGTLINAGDAMVSDRLIAIV